MDTQTPKKTLVHPIERILVILAAAASVFLTIGIWRSVSSERSIWPLPGLYFVELAAVAIVTALVFLRDDPSSVTTAWISAGIYVAFSILGALSIIGLFYLPSAIMFVMLAVLATVHQDRSFLWGLLAFIIAAAGQALLMFLFINLLYAAQGAGR